MDKDIEKTIRMLLVRGIDLAVSHGQQVGSFLFISGSHVYSFK